MNESHKENEVNAFMKEVSEAMIDELRELKETWKILETDSHAVLEQILGLEQDKSEQYQLIQNHIKTKIAQKLKSKMSGIKDKLKKTRSDMPEVEISSCESAESFLK